MTALSLRNGHTRSASSAAGAEVQLAGGIDQQQRLAVAAQARRYQPSRQVPTSRSRVSGGMHSRLKRATPCSANSPVPRAGGGR